MLDIFLLRKDLDTAIARLETRKKPQAFLDVSAFQALESERKTLQTRTEELQAQRNQLIDCAEGAKLIERKMAEIKEKIANLQSIYRYLDQERLNLEASAARQLELQRLNSAAN